MIKVLITSFGSNTSIGVAKSLNVSNNAIKIIGIDTNPFYRCSGSIYADFFYQVPNCIDDNYEKILLEIIKKENIDCVIPIHDTEVEIVSSLSEKYPNITKWVVNKNETINLCNNKLRINNLLQENEINIPKIYANTNLVSPFIYKPIKGVSSRGIEIIETLDEHNTFVIKEGFFAQEFIEGKEYTVDCYTSYNNEDIFKCSVRERIETKSGMSTKGQIMINDKIENACKKIHQLLHYKGCSNIQFIIKNDVPYFIEINPRFAGGGVLTYLNGLNLPLITIQELINNDSTLLTNSFPKVGTKMVRFLEETFYDEKNAIIRPRRNAY